MPDPQTVEIEHPDTPGQMMLINLEDFNPSQHRRYTVKKPASESQTQNPVSDTGNDSDGSDGSESGKSEGDQEKPATKPRALKKPAATKAKPDAPDKSV